jgi:outer membrane protein assembly factor BamB
LQFALCVSATLGPASPARGGSPLRRSSFYRLVFAPLEPWSLDRPPRPFAELCFEDRGILGRLTENDARGLLEKVGGNDLALWHVGGRGAGGLRFRGLAKLRRWLPDAVLRLSFFGGPLRIHFWDGKQGLALYCYAWPSHWAAYRTTWPPGKPPPADRPAPILLFATDEHRAERLGGGACEVRCQDGLIVLTKGDVRLMTAPLGGQPLAVYLESTGPQASQGVMLGDLAMCRSGPVPDNLPREHPLVLGKEPPAALGWREELAPGTRFQRLAGGGVELAAQAAAGPAWVTLPVPRPGLYEVLVEIDAASPGSGLFLSEDQQPPFQGIEFVRHPNPNCPWTVLAPSRFGKQPPVAAWPDHEQRVVPYAGGRQWLRLISRPGVWKCWASGDGVHWGEALPPSRDGQGWRFLGLYVDSSGKRPAAGNAAAAIRVRTVQVRQIDGLGSPGAGTAAQDALAQLAESVRRAGPLAARLALLQDAVLLGGPDDAGERCLACWEALFRRLLTEGSPEDFDLARRAYLAAAPGSAGPKRPPGLPAPDVPVPWQVARDRLLLLVAQQQWDELFRWCGQLAYWHRGPERGGVWLPEQAPLGSLVEWLIEEIGATRGSAEGHKVITPEMNWQRALALPVNREALNFLSELQAAAADRLFRDVAQGLAAANLPAAGGLVPDGEDPMLYTAFPTAVELLVARHPEICKAVSDRTTPAERLRIAEALAEGDPAAVQRLTVQYCGTPVAASAYAWLGDRALSGGAFVRALTDYRRAISAALPADRPALSARIRLAAAFLGREEGEPPRQPLQFGAQEIAPEQFEQWVREILNRDGEGKRGPPPAKPRPVPAGTVHTNGESPLLPAPLRLSPSGLEPQRRAVFDGDLGEPGPPAPAPAGAPPFVPAGDWPARQLAVAAADKLLLVSNRFQIAALALPDGERRWVYGLGKEQGPTHGWPLVPMRPTVAAERVYARLLPKSGHPQIVCLDLADGQRLWQRECPGDAVSDPLLLGPRLLVLAVESSGRQPGASLGWVELDRDSGELLARKPLLELRSPWATQQMCQAAVVGQRVVATVGGLVLAFEPDEPICWLRSNLCPPPALAPSPGIPYPEPPLAAGGRLYLTQSGLPSVECLDAETGRLYWRQCLLGLTRILGLCDGRLLVRAGDALAALRAETGEVLWRRDVPGLLEGVVQANAELLLCGRRQPLDKDKFCPVLEWLDLRSGRTLARSPLAELASKSPALGPMLAAGGRLWGFAGVYGKDGLLDGRRDLLELVPHGPADPPAGDGQ